MANEPHKKNPKKSTKLRAPVGNKPTQDSNAIQLRGLSDFLLAFPNEEACIEYFTYIRWQGKVCCAYCNSPKVYKIKEDNRYKCGDCKKSFSLTSKSIFANSKIPLRTWFMALFLLYTSKKGYSAIKLAKDLNVTYRTAWHLSMKLRNVIRQMKNNEPLTGFVEMDEAYMGRRDGSIKNKRGRGTTKQVMVGMVERGDNPRAISVPAHNSKAETLLEIARKFIDSNAVILTDDSLSYSLVEKEFKRKKVRHSKYQGKKHVLPENNKELAPKWAYYDPEINTVVHTNTIEGFWSIAKNSILLTHHSVAKKYLDLYCDEFAERQSNRLISNGEWFNKFLNESKEVEYTWKDITTRVPTIYGNKDDS